MEGGKRYRVHFKKDDEVNVWIATSKDVPGLVLESESIDTLVDRVSKAIPELMELEGRPVVHKFALDYV